MGQKELHPLMKKIEGVTVTTHTWCVRYHMILDDFFFNLFLLLRGPLQSVLVHIKTGTAIRYRNTGQVDS